MNEIQGLTEQAKQHTAITLDDGSRVSLTLEFRPQQRGWFFDISHEDFACNGLRLVTSPNILRGFLKLIPFGLAIVTTTGAEPMAQDDFVSGLAAVYLLDADDVADVEAGIFAGN